MEMSKDQSQRVKKKKRINHHQRQRIIGVNYFNLDIHCSVSFCTLALKLIKKFWKGVYHLCMFNQHNFQL